MAEVKVTKWSVICVDKIPNSWNSMAPISITTTLNMTASEILEMTFFQVHHYNVPHKCNTLIKHLLLFIIEGVHHCLWWWKRLVMVILVLVEETGVGDGGGEYC